VVPQGFKTKRGKISGDFHKIIYSKNFEYVNRVFGAITSSFIEEGVTDRQWEKWEKGISTQATPVSSTLVDLYAQVLSERYAKDLPGLTRKAIREQRKNSFPLFECLTATSVPYFTEKYNLSHRDKSLIGEREKTKVLNAYLSQIASVPNATLDYIGKLHELDVLDPEKPTLDWHQREYTLFEAYNEDSILPDTSREFNSDVVGHIGYIQQEKSKLRAVANPNRFAQHYTLPFGELLQSLTDTHPGSFVKDQELGHAFVQDLIRTKSGTIYSMDLSAATDTMSFETMYLAVEKFFKEASGLNDSEREYLLSSLDYFQELSSGLWYSAELDKRTYGRQQYVTFAQGQPLGLRPSFPFLTMQNLATYDVATALAREKGWDGKTQVACVGDDMLISCDSMRGDEYNPAKIYSMIMESSLGTSVNLEKTLVDKRMAEFCGKIITARKIYQKSPKWKLPTDDNVVSVLSTFPEFKLSILTDQRKALSAVKKIPPSYGGVYGKFRPDKTIPLEKAITAFELASFPSRDELFLGTNDTKYTVRPGQYFHWFDMASIEDDSDPRDFMASELVPLANWADEESALPSIATFDYRIQDYVVPEPDPHRSLLKLIRKGERMESLLPAIQAGEEASLEFTRPTQPGIRYFAKVTGDGVPLFGALKVTRDRDSELVWENASMDISMEGYYALLKNEEVANAVQKRRALQQASRSNSRRIRTSIFSNRNEFLKEALYGNEENEQRNDDSDRAKRAPEAIEDSQESPATGRSRIRGDGHASSSSPDPTISTHAPKTVSGEDRVKSVPELERQLRAILAKEPRDIGAIEREGDGLDRSL
jgi:hypothetical protein